MAIQEIRVGLKDGGGADERTSLFKKILDDQVRIDIVTVYAFEGIGEEDADVLRRLSLADPIINISSVNSPLFIEEDSSVIRIGYDIGVSDPSEEYIVYQAEALGVHPTAFQSSKEYIIHRKISPQELEQIGGKLVNAIERVIDEPIETLATVGEPRPLEVITITHLSDEALDMLSKQKDLFLNVEQMRAIQAHYQKIGREPTDVELYMIAQTNSEHSKHNTFNATIITKDGQRLPSMMERVRKQSESVAEQVGIAIAFKDNAGGIWFYGDVLIFKIETHNKPAAIEPYGAALTKMGGDYRDIMATGLGGETLAGFVVIGVAPLNTPEDQVPPGVIHPLRVFTETSRGEREFGNPSGFPTLGMMVISHPDFLYNPLSVGGAIGIIPGDMYEKGMPEPGDIILTLGGKTGRDGMLGAAVSSGASTDETVKKIEIVQLGNPIEQRRMFEALLACREEKLIRVIGDCGGGGHSSTIGEMAEELGAEVNLDMIPLKDTNLAAWEIWLSESQERMVIAIDPKNRDAVERICRQWDVPVSTIGHFTGDSYLRLSHKGEVVADLSMDFLHHGMPKREMVVQFVEYPEDNDEPETPKDVRSVFTSVLGDYNISSLKPMHDQYDKTVQARTVLFPYTGPGEAPNDAFVITPHYGELHGAVVSMALNPMLNRISPFDGGAWAVAVAAAKLTAVGGNIREAALSDNFTTPYPDEESLGATSRLLDGSLAMASALGTGYCVGKDSMGGTHEGDDGIKTNIPHVLLVTAVGRIPDINKTISVDIKDVGSTLCLIGAQDVDRLGGSVYFQTQGKINSHVPRINMTEFDLVLEAVHGAIQKGAVRSCCTVEKGGLVAALSKMCIGGDIGAVVDVSPLQAKRFDFALTNETPALVVELANGQSPEELFGNVPYTILGETSEEKSIVIYDKDKEIGTVDLYDIKSVWESPMKEVFS